MIPCARESQFITPGGAVVFAEAQFPPTLLPHRIASGASLRILGVNFGQRFCLARGKIVIHRSDGALRY